MFENCDLSDVVSFSVKQASYFRNFPEISELKDIPWPNFKAS